MNKKMYHVSLFTGAGGLDIGLEKCGFETIAAVENDKYCQETLDINRSRFNNNFHIFGDITKITAEDVFDVTGLKPGEITLVSGGPPCQPFSTAGKREALNDPRGNLFFHYARMIQGLNPRFFIMENVRGLLSAALVHRPLKERGNGHAPLTHEEKLGSLFNGLIIPVLENELGYELAHGLVNAINYGAPQDRKRLIIIGSRDHEIGYEQFRPLEKPLEFLVSPTHSKNGENGLLSVRTLGDAIHDLDDPSPEYLNYSEARAKVMELVPPGKNWRFLRDTYGEEFIEKVMGGAYHSTGGRVGFFRRLSYDKWSPTVLASPMHKGTSLCHPEETRPLSIREYARIQGFPDEMEFAGPTREKYRQIGNAVPVQLAEAIGKAILGVIKKK